MAQLSQPNNRYQLDRVLNFAGLDSSEAHASSFLKMRLRQLLWHKDFIDWSWVRNSMDARCCRRLACSAITIIYLLLWW